jgi:UDPglucose 6-dehydrogenase
VRGEHPAISVIGLGKLGAPLAAVLASKGFRVTGVDIDQSCVRALRGGRAPVREPGLQESITAAGDHLTATTDYAEAVGRSAATFVILPTPSGEDGFFTNRFVLDAVRQIGKALCEKSDYHLVVVTSTVMPGSTGGVIRETLERVSGRTVGDDLGLCYNPEFIALGSVIRDMLNPDFVLIGESDERAGGMLSSIHHAMCDNTPEVHRMNFVNAEITKLAVNTFVTTKISYANMLADLCDRLAGADVDVVTDTLGSDSRIGRKYLKGALAYGGPCFPRDNRAFAAVARGLGVRADLAEATDRINSHQTTRLVSMVSTHARPRSRIGVMGLSYKPDAPVVEESAGVNFAAALVDAGYEVIVYDPLAQAAGIAELSARGIKVESASSAKDCAQSADVLVVTVPLPEFAEFPAEVFDRRDIRSVIIDPWRIVPRDALSGVADVVYPGCGS